MSWSNAQVTEFARRLKKTWGPCWHVLVPEVKCAIVDSFVLSTVFQLEKNTVDIDSVRALSAGLHEKMGYPYRMHTEVE